MMEGDEINQCGATDPGNVKILHINNLKPDATKIWLTEYLRKNTKEFQHVVALPPCGKKKYALVSYKSPSAAKDALLVLQGQTLGPQESPISVSFKKRKGQHLKRNCPENVQLLNFSDNVTVTDGSKNNKSKYQDAKIYTTVRNENSTGVSNVKSPTALLGNRTAITSQAVNEAKTGPKRSEVEHNRLHVNLKQITNEEDLAASRNKPLGAKTHKSEKIMPKADVRVCSSHGNTENKACPGKSNRTEKQAKSIEGCQSNVSTNDENIHVVPVNSRSKDGDKVSITLSTKTSKPNKPAKSTHNIAPDETKCKGVVSPVVDQKGTKTAVERTKTTNVPKDTKSVQTKHSRKTAKTSKSVPDTLDKHDRNKCSIKPKAQKTYHHGKDCTEDAAALKSVTRKSDTHNGHCPKKHAAQKKVEDQVPKSISKVSSAKNMNGSNPVKNMKLSSREQKSDTENCNELKSMQTDAKNGACSTTNNTNPRLKTPYDSESSMDNLHTAYGYDDIPEGFPALKRFADKQEIYDNVTPEKLSNTCLRITGRLGERLDKNRMCEFLRRSLTQKFTLQYENNEYAAILQFHDTGNAEHAFSKLEGRPLTYSGAPVDVEYISTIPLIDAADDVSDTSSVISVVPQESTDKTAILKITTEDPNLQTLHFKNLLEKFNIGFGNVHVFHDKTQSNGTSARIKMFSIEDAIEAEQKLKECMMGQPAKTISIEIDPQGKKPRNRRRNRKRARKTCSVAVKSAGEQLGTNGTCNPQEQNSKTQDGEHIHCMAENISKQSRSTNAAGTNEVEENELDEYHHNDDNENDIHVPEEQQVADKKSKITSTSVLVRNIPDAITKEDIQGFFSQFDLDVQGMQFRGTYAVVQFQYAEEATEAWNILRTQSREILGEKLEVKFIRNSTGTHGKGYRNNPDQQGQNNMTCSAQTSYLKKSVAQGSNSNVEEETNAEASNILGPNDVLIKNLPRSVKESDIAEAVMNCPDQVRSGLNDVRQTGNKAVLNFKTQQDAFKAVAELRFIRVKGHELNAQLAVHNPDFDKLMYRRQRQALITQIKQTERNISLEIEENMTQLAREIIDIEDDLLYCESQEVDRYETTKDVLQNKLDENQQYYDEFKQTALKMTADLDNMVDDDLEEHERQQSLLQIDDIRRRIDREGRRLRNPLPIYGRRTEILEAVTGPSTRACIIQAETGSGKSTQVPQYLMEFLQYQSSSSKIEGRVVCTQPRRVAAITLTQRIAEEYDCEVGQEVGFIAGNKRKVGDKTLSTFMTDRSLLNFCLADSNYLDSYKYVIIDEAHERSVDTDILLAMLKKEQVENNKQFTIIIMSATIDVDLFSGYFDCCPVIDIPGRTFPVDIEWCTSTEGQSIGNDDYVTRAVEKCYEIHVNEGIEGDMLVFLTSQVEIDRACRNLKRKLGITPGGDGDDSAEILPLHGKLPPHDQFKVFKKPRDDKRKIVFATNIAETSVTIPGVKYVIDTGMVKELQYDTRKNMSLLKVTSVSQASAEQRKGRAGRTGPGKCFRLYSHEEYQEMEQTMKPEILRVHLGMAVMKLLQMGVRDADKFDFVESPEPGAIQQAIKTLILLGAVNDKERTLTDVGNQMAKLPVEPRLAKLIIEGAKRGFVEDAIAMAALISAPGNVFFQGGSDAERKVSDQLKLRFCVEDGDVITILGIFREWQVIQGDKAKNRWCKENSLNAKTLRLVQESVDELTITMKRSNLLDELTKCDTKKPEKSKDVDRLPIEIETETGTPVQKRPECVTENNAAVHVNEVLDDIAPYQLQGEEKPDEDGCRQERRVDCKEREGVQTEEEECILNDESNQVNDYCDQIEPNVQLQYKCSSEIKYDHIHCPISRAEKTIKEKVVNTSINDGSKQLTQQINSEGKYDSLEKDHDDESCEQYDSEENSHHIEKQPIAQVEEQSGQNVDSKIFYNQCDSNNEPQVESSPEGNVDHIDPNEDNIEQLQGNGGDNEEYEPHNVEENINHDIKQPTNHKGNIPLDSNDSRRLKEQRIQCQSKGQLQGQSSSEENKQRTHSNAKIQNEGRRFEQQSHVDEICDSLEVVTHQDENADEQHDSEGSKINVQRHQEASSDHEGCTNLDEKVTGEANSGDKSGDRPLLEEKGQGVQTNKNEVLRKILMSAYFENLSVFNGRIRAGYTVASQLKTAVFHPSSALSALNISPKWVIYGELRRTSNDFLCVVTPVDISWIHEVAPVEFSRHIDLETLKSCVMTEVKIDAIGTAIMKSMSKNRFEFVRNIEDEITRRTKVPCIIEVNLEHGVMVVCIATHSKMLAEEEVKRSLNRIKAKTQREHIEIAVGTYGSVRHVVKSGGATEFVLIDANDYITVEWSGISQDMPAEDFSQVLEEMFLNEEDIVDVVKYPSHTAAAKQGKWGKTTFVSTQKAKQAIEIGPDIDPSGVVSVKPILPETRRRVVAADVLANVTFKTTVIVSWYTRQSKGHAFLNCHSYEDALYLKDHMDGTWLGNHPIRCKLGNKNKTSVFVYQLHKDVTNEDLEEHVRDNSSIEAHNVFIPREKTTHNTPDAAHKKQLRRIFRNVCEQVEVNIPEVRGRNALVRRAFVNLEPNLGKAEYRELNNIVKNGCRGVNDELYRMTQNTTCDLYCSQQVFTSLKGSLQREANMMECKVEFTDTKKTPPDKRIRISGETHEDVDNVTKKLKTVLCPEELDARSLVDKDVASIWMDKVLNKLTNQHLNNILRRNKAHADIIVRRQAIMLYGKDSDRESLKKDLREFFSFALKTMFREVDVSSRSGGQKGRAMRALIRKYGPHLERLKNSTGVDNITIDLKRGLLFIDGTEMSYESLISELDTILRELTVSSSTEDNVIKDECGVCYSLPTEVNSKPYRLAACGHFFCLACLKEHLKESGNSKKFPIACPQCDDFILLCDIKIIYPKDDERHELFTAGLDAYVASNADGGIKFCPGPDCCMVYKTEINGSTMKCEECGFKYCNGCGEKVHPHNMSCKEFQVSQKKTDDVEKWMQQSGVDAKKCPICKTVIEKNQGCNHMICGVCKKDICWKCLEVFDSDQQCYDHLSRKHGGIFDPLQQEMNDYGNDAPYNVRLEAARGAREVQRQHLVDALLGDALIADRLRREDQIQAERRRQTELERQRADRERQNWNYGYNEQRRREQAAHKATDKSKTKCTIL